MKRCPIKRLLPLVCVLLASFSANAQSGEAASTLPSGADRFNPNTATQTVIAQIPAPQNMRNSPQRRHPPQRRRLALLTGCTVETWQRGHRRIGSSRRRYLDAATFGYDSCVQRPATGRRPWAEIVWSVGMVLDEAINIGNGQTKALAFAISDTINPNDYTFQWRGACNSDAPTCRLNIDQNTQITHQAIITVRQRGSGAVVLEQVVTALAHTP